MTAEHKTLENIRSYLETCIGKSISIRTDLGRKKSFQAEGVLTKTYPNVFTVNLDQSNAVRRRSYAYVDILTRQVELTVRTRKQL